MRPADKRTLCVCLIRQSPGCIPPTLGFNICQSIETLIWLHWRLWLQPRLLCMRRVASNVQRKKPMSALGQKQTCAVQLGMSALGQ